MEKKSKKIKILILFLVLFFSSIFANDDLPYMNFDYYDSITTSAEFKNNFFYMPASLKANNVFDDIKVSIVEVIPFAFLYTFAYLFFYEAISRNTWQPKMKTLEEYKETYIKTAIIFAGINVSINFLTYYKYGKENKNEKK